MTIHSVSTQTEIVSALQHQIQKLERRIPQKAEDVLSTGCCALDALFPDHGIRRGSLVEWFGEGLAAGTGTLALLAARHLLQRDRPGLLVDAQRQLYPLALAALGLDLSTIIWVTPECERDSLWTYEQALRCAGVSFVWGSLRTLTSNSFRRLQLAAEVSHGVGFLIRPAGSFQAPSWADVRLLVSPRPSMGKSPRWRVEVVHSHQQSERRYADIVLDARRGMLCKAENIDETNRLPLVSQLVHSAHCHRQTGT